MLYNIFFGKVTLSIIKPDAVKNRYVLHIIRKIINEKFKIIELKIIKISKKLASKFYKKHSDKYYFNELTNFMSSGFIIPMILKKNNAVKDFRKLIGNTNPNIAKKGTIRSLYATSIEENAIHGSDSNNNAIKECIFFFPTENFLKK